MTKSDKVEGNSFSLLKTSTVFEKIFVFVAAEIKESVSVRLAQVRILTGNRSKVSLRKK